MPHATISSQNPVLAARVRAFVAEVGPENASNSAIAEMLRREFREPVTQGQVAGIARRLRLDRGARRIDWTEEMLVTLRECRAAEMGWVAIGRHMELSDTACREKYTEMGWPVVVPRNTPPVPVTAWTEERANRFRAMHANGDSYSVMSAALGSSKSALKQKAVRMGLPSRDTRPVKPERTDLRPFPRQPPPPSPQERAVARSPLSVANAWGPWPPAPGATPERVTWVLVEDIIVGGQPGPEPVERVPEWVSRPIPAAKGCQWPLWTHNQHYHDVEKPFCDIPTLVTRDYSGQPKAHVYCRHHESVAHGRVTKNLET